MDLEPRMSSLGTGDASRMSNAGINDSARSSIDVTANFGAPAPRSPALQQNVPNFGGSSVASSPAMSDAMPKTMAARFGGLAPLQEGRSSQLLDVEALGTTDLGQIEQAPPAANPGRLPSQYELATPVIMQEITQNLRKTMVGLSNEVKVRENEDWRLEQGFTQLDSRRELMCVQLHTRYEQTKNELEALGKQLGELQGNSSSFREVRSEVEQKFQEFSAQMLAQGEDNGRVGAMVATLQSDTSSLMAFIERLQEKQATMEARAAAIEAKSQAAIARLEAAPLQPQGQPLAPGALEECMEKQALLLHRCDQLEDADAARKAEANFLRQSVVECKAFAEKSGLFEKRFCEIESKSVAHSSKFDALQDSFSHLQGLIQSAEDRQRGQLSELEVQRSGQKTQIESLQESLTQLQARLQQQRLDESKQMEQLDAQSAGHGVRIESLQESVGQMQAWLQKQSMIEEKRAQIDAYNAAHRAETDGLRNSIKGLESQLESQGPVDARSAALDNTEAVFRAEMEIISRSLESHKAQQKAEVDSVAISIQRFTGALEEQRNSNEEVWSVMNKSIQKASESIEEVRTGSEEAKIGFKEHAASIQIFSDSLAQLRSSSEQVKSGSSTQLDEKFNMLEVRLADHHAHHTTSADRLRDTINDLQGSSQRYEVKLQDVMALIGSQDERVKIEMGMVQQGRQELQSDLGILQAAKSEMQARLDSLQSKADLAQSQIQGVVREAAESVKMQTATDVVESQRLASQVLRLESQGNEQQREVTSLLGMLESLQGRVESFQANSEDTQIQLGQAIKQDCEAAMNAKLQGISKESKAVEELFAKLESSAQALRNFVEAETSGTQAGLKRLEGEHQEDRRRFHEEVKRLETKDAEQQNVLTEVRSRLDLQVEAVRSQLESVAGGNTPSNDGFSASEASEQRAILASLRAQLQAGTEALQQQHDTVRSQLQEHISKSLETTFSLESRLLAAERQATSLEATSQVRAVVASGDSDGAMWEELMLCKLGEARSEWQIALEEERTRSTQKVKQLQLTLSEDCRTQAATQARIVVQSMLSQELDSWRKELSTSRVTAPTPILGAKTPRGDRDEDTESPGLAEAVRRLDDRLAMQRREAAALDELLRSELEVQRRQQSLTGSTLQSIQDRLQTVEERTDAMRTQLEDTLREGSCAPDVCSTPGGARIQVALTDIAEQVITESGHSSTGDDIHRRIKALSAKMAQCQGSTEGSLQAPGGSMIGGGMLVSQNSRGQLDSLAMTLPASRSLPMDETGQLPGLENALNYPQALTDLIQPTQHQNANFSFRQPSMERGALQPSPIAPGSPTNSRGLYAFRQLSPSSAHARQQTPSSAQRSGQQPGQQRLRAISPGASRSLQMQSPRRPPTPGRGLPGQPDQRMMPREGLLPEYSQIQRITSAPPDQRMMQQQTMVGPRRVSNGPPAPGPLGIALSGAPGPLGIALSGLGSAAIPGTGPPPVASPVPGMVAPASIRAKSSRCDSHSDALSARGAGY